MLEEREFLIRRLGARRKQQCERARKNSDQHRAAAERSPGWRCRGHDGRCVGELIRIDGAGPATYALSRRTRIGRAAGCEMQIESGSVSRHHALVLVGPRDTMIEDLNSTNGVLVNGRKVVRQVLSDGDAITIGETQFRYCAKPVTSLVGAQARRNRLP